MEVEEEFREEVSAMIVEFAKGPQLRNSLNFQHVIDSMLQWRTETSDQLMISMMNGDVERHDKGRYLLPALEEIGTAKAADAMSIGLADTTFGDDTARALIRMGAVAEQATLDWRKHEDHQVRYRVYHILAEIGTLDSIDPLKANREREKNVEMKKLVGQVIKAIKARHPE